MHDRHTLIGNVLSFMYLKANLVILGLIYRNWLNNSAHIGADI